MTDHFRMCASAFRTGTRIDATIYATLPDGCHDGEITDIYPGGAIVYTEDPGVAQVFIRFTRRDPPCDERIWEWEGRREIPDDRHDRLEVIGEFEGDVFRLGAPVYESKPERDVCQFIVIGIVTEGHEQYPMRCCVVQEGTEIPARYSRVFGPDSKASCEDWRARRCVSA